MKRFVFILSFALIMCTLISAGWTQDVHSGQYAARLEWTNQWVGGMDSGLDRQNSLIPIQGAHDYTFKAWVRSANSELDDVFDFRFADFTESETHIADDAKPWTTTSNDWVRYSFTHTADTNTAFLNVAFRIVNTNGGAIVIDDVTLHDDTDSTTVTITNAGFEDWPGAENDPPTDWRFFEVGGADGSITRIEATPTPTPTPIPGTAAKKELWQPYQ